MCYQRIFLIPSRKIFKTISLPIIKRNTLMSSNPYASFAISHYNSGNITCDRSCVGIIMTIYGKIISIKFIDTIVCSKPHIVCFILCDGKYCILRQAFIYAYMRKPNSPQIKSSHRSTYCQQNNQYHSKCIHTLLNILYNLRAILPVLNLKTIM